MHLATAANGLHGAVLGHFEAQCGQLKDLACLADIGKVQRVLARLTSTGHIVRDDVLGSRHLAQGAAGVPLLPACGSLACNAKGFGAGLVQAVTGGRLAGVLAVQCQVALQVVYDFLHRINPRQQLLHLPYQRPQPNNQFVFLRVAQLV